MRLSSTIACGSVLFVACCALADGRIPEPDAGSLAEAERIAKELSAAEPMTATARRDYLAKIDADADGLLPTRTFARACAELMERAAAEGRFDAAADFGRAAFAASQKGRDIKLTEQLRSRGPQIMALAEEYRQFDAAQKTLADVPDDSAANLVCGRYLATVQGDWDKAIAMLAKAADPAWSEPARLDLASPIAPGARLAVADAWWQLADQAAEPDRNALMTRAAHWYRLAMPELDASDRDRAIQRLAVAKGFGPVGTNDAAAVSADQDRREMKPEKPQAAPFPVGQWVDLLPLVEPDRQAVSGKWQLADGTLNVVPGDEPARLSLPAAPGADYDLEVEFTRSDTFRTVGVIIPVGNRQCLAALNFGSGANGLDMIDGQRANDNVSTSVGALNNDRKYSLELNVRLDGSEAAVTAKLDGRPFFFYRGPAKSLALNRDWRLKSQDTLGLAAQSPTQFHNVRLKRLQ